MKPLTCNIKFRWEKTKDNQDVGRKYRRTLRHPESEDVTEDLLQEPGLFRKFAQLDMGKNWQVFGEVIPFANEYGDLLALPREIERHAEDSDWAKAIRAMRDAVVLWDRLNGKITKTEQQKLRQELHKKVHAALTDTATPSHTTLGLTAELTQALYPKNLLAYMWLMFARVVSGEIEERICEGKKRGRVGCPGYIYVGKGDGLKRNNKTACGKACQKWLDRHPE